MSIQDLIQKARSKEREFALCDHLWVPQGRSAIDHCISSMFCSLCGERRAATDDENLAFAMESKAG